MAQWTYQFSGHTHDTKILDIEESLQQTVAAYYAASDAERDRKLKAAQHLAERLLVARLKALRAKRARLSEPDLKSGAGQQVQKLQHREHQLATQGVDGILQEFGLHGNK